ncbi:MAG: translation initiation factor IF-3 [Planctomycetota bacterium]
MGRPGGPVHSTTLSGRSVSITEPKYRIIDRPEPGEYRLIDESGAQLGIMDAVQALELAREQELDLVLLDPNGRPPTCKLMNFGRYKYNLRKRMQKGKKTVRKRKEIKLRPKVEEHDFQVKARRARKFLEDGHKVMVTLLFRGREQKHPELGFDVMQKFFEALSDLAKKEKEPAREAANRLSMMLAKK